MRINRRPVLYLDVDGTLTNPMPRYYKTYCDSLAHVSTRMGEDGLRTPLYPLSFQDFRKNKRIRTTDIAFGKLSGIPDNYISDYLIYIRATVNSDTSHGIDPALPYTDWALNTFKQQGFDIILVTLRPDKEVKEMLAYYQWVHLIKDVYGSTSSEVTLQNYSEAKRDLLGAALLNYASSQSSRNNTYMIGDTEADIYAGKSHNITTISITSGLRSYLYLLGQSPDFILPDLKSVAVQFQRSFKLAG
jgi:phosphoglycolate phosphatase